MRQANLLRQNVAVVAHNMVSYHFYQVEDPSPAALEAVLPALLEPFYEAGQRVVLCSGPNRLKRFDEALWSYNKGSFLAHGIDDAAYAAGQPILLSSTPQPANGAEVIVFVGLEVENYPQSMGEFAQVVDLFNGVERQKKAARQRWKNLSEQNVEQAYYAWQNEAWQKKA